MKTWREVYDNARENATLCRCCPVCNGVACRGETPGVGGKGSGSSFIRNVEMLQKVKITLDTITSNDEVDTSSSLFGHPVSLPVYAAPIGGIEINYGAKVSELSYTEMLVDGCLRAGTLAFTGDGKIPSMFEEPLSVLKKHQGAGIPTIKPWADDEIAWRAKLCLENDVLAVASDIDASGLSALRTSEVPVGFKDVDDLKRFKKLVGKPLILKGIMSVKGAMKALEAGADGIVVSNHGGRVLDDCLASIEVLKEIAEAVNGRMTILVDGGFRSGNDVFKALALGADGVLIGRPMSLAVIGGGSDGVKIYLDKIALELREAMAMAGCKKIEDITLDNVTVLF
ncbi:MAG: alpha-hydroxy-acid oxidizing protein [Erysipelotrichaceae bacterium]|jgi:4-hydroxymandelate oxidase|nr:alpha-hydroxy-acid oxidizing protein [Erysipelotrichaceae bacterium]